MRKTQWILGILVGLLLIPVVLVTSVEYVISKGSFFEEAYEKHNIVENVGISQTDLMFVTVEMMNYLTGTRESLDDINVEIKGEKREFFNDKEKLHMEDVKDIFMGARTLKRVFLFIILSIVVLFFFLKNNSFYIMAKMIQIVFGIFFVIGSLISYVIYTDFTKYFTVFHEMFFDNDLWILNPKTDLLINIVPEPFFIDSAIRIGAVFGISIVSVFIIATAFRLYRDRLIRMGE